MVQLVPSRADSSSHIAFRSMFAARKEIFVDLLKWDLPVLSGQYEVDQFDTPGARYIILTDKDLGHLGSVRLLPTTRPHILDSIFSALCAGDPPRGPQIWELTRFCLDRKLRATERRAIRNQLVTALVEFALDNGIETYTCVAEASWLQQILNFGWQCRLRGELQPGGASQLGALAISISSATPAALSAGGIWCSLRDQETSARCANG